MEYVSIHISFHQTLIGPVIDYYVLYNEYVACKEEWQ